jgi:hypothetical protein
MRSVTLERKDWLFSVVAPIRPVSFPSPPSIPQPPPQTLDDSPNGPGTMLSKMLSKIGINSTPNCSCRRRAIEMNNKGPDWCEQNTDMIVGWLREEAQKRKLPFVDFAGKLLIQRAIKMSRKALSQQT